jgi:lipid-binding SYLF domain-containing protein
MRLCNRLSVVVFVLAAAFIFIVNPRPAGANSAQEVDRDVDSALMKLYGNSAAAKELSKLAKAILVFPGIVKGGLIIGGQYGEGALRKNGKTVDYYRTVAASYGLQIGAQSFGYALFFLTDSALEYLERSEGWEVGVGPNIVVVDQGAARSLTTTTAKEDIYAFFFDQKGLMAGISLEGSKISRIDKR